MTTLVEFLCIRNRRQGNLPAVSLFSGAGLSDIGYELAGFSFRVQCELDKNRAELGKRNFPDSEWIVGKLQDERSEILRKYKEQIGNVAPALISITPPCQGMSSSNSGRGKISSVKDSDHRNTLLLEALPIIKVLKPRIIVAENVAPLLNRMVKWQDETKSVVQVFNDGLDGYKLFVGVIEMADYGIPQMRKRAILVAINEDEPIVAELKAKRLLPWPRPTHAQIATKELSKWVTIKDWFKTMKYPRLNARTQPSDPNLPLHVVVEYPEGDHRYELVSSIRANSGKNAYANDRCPTCRKNSISGNLAYCPRCNHVLYNRPVTKSKQGGRWRLIKGFESSYRRASPDKPAPTVTTNSSHLGSDNKIHPWENRVLSIIECADLQTVPRFYDWDWALDSRHTYLIRNAVGEALPPYFTYLHGRILRDLLEGRLPESKLSRVDTDGQNRDLDVLNNENDDK